MLKRLLQATVVACVLAMAVAMMTSATVKAEPRVWKVYLFVCEPYAEDCSVSGGYWVINSDPDYGPEDCTYQDPGADSGTAQCATGNPPLESVGWVNGSPVHLLDGSPVAILEGYGAPHKPLTMLD